MGRNEDVDLARNAVRTTLALISPGARYAFNLPNDLQIVVGAAMPIASLPIHPIGDYSSTSPLSTRS